MGVEDDSPARKALIFALDYPTLEQARSGAAAVAEYVGVIKVGLQLFTRHGPEAVSLGRELGIEVFLDLKLHDIPATVQRAVASAGHLGARFLTVHASGGHEMLAAAVEQAREAPTPLTIVAITVLTSLDADDLQRLGCRSDPRQQVERLAQLAWEAGVRAFVCSPAEAAVIRARCGPQARIITPGIRPAGTGAQDQKRISTPADAIGNGADMLVVGRPIRDAADPAASAATIVAQIAAAQGQDG